MRVLLLSLLGVVAWAQTPAPARPAASKPTAAAKPAAATKPAATSKPAATAKPAAAAAPAETAKPSAGASGDPVVFRVGEESMTKSQFDNFVANLPEQVRQQMVSPGGRRQIAEQLAQMLGMAQEARRRGLADSPAVKQQLRLQEQSILASALVREIQEKYEPAEADLKSYYDSHLSDYEQVKARHILIRFKGSRVPLKTGQKDLTEEESLAKAKELKARIEKGEDFAAIAKAESDDAGSGAQGGDLGSFGRGRMVPEFEKAAFEQPVGKVGDPVRSAFGYHVIQVEQRNARPFDEVKTEIAQSQKQAGTQKALDELKSKTQVTIDETYFGPATAPGRPAPGVPSAK